MDCTPGHLWVSLPLPPHSLWLALSLHPLLPGWKQVSPPGLPPRLSSLLPVLPVTPPVTWGLFPQRETDYVHPLLKATLPSSCRYKIAPSPTSPRVPYAPAVLEFHTVMCSVPATFRTWNALPLFKLGSRIPSTVKLSWLHCVSTVCWADTVFCTAPAPLTSLWGHWDRDHLFSISEFLEPGIVPVM